MNETREVDKNYHVKKSQTDKYNDTEKQEIHSHQQ